MLSLALMTALAASAAAAEGPVPVRTVALSVYTKKLVPVTDLTAEEVVLKEAGQPRKVLGLELDRRALEVVIVVDTSAAVEAYYRSDIVPAVVEFWKALPPGTKFSLRSTSPGKVTDFDDDPAAAEAKLRMIAVAGGDYAFDSMIDGSKDLGRRGAPRRVVVYVGSASVHATKTLTGGLMATIGEVRATPMVILVLASARSSSSQGPQADGVYAWDVQGYFEQMTKAYRGVYVEALSTLAVAQWLKQFAADLGGQYRVRYESQEGEPGEVKVEVKRKDTKLRVGRTATEVVRPAP